MTGKPRQIARVYRKVRISEQGSDLEYWLSQPPAARLAALERIRREYHMWKYGAEPRLQKVVTKVKNYSAFFAQGGIDFENCLRDSQKSRG